MKTLFTSFLLLMASITFAQSTQILPGLVLPQMTTAQRGALVSPVNGMLVFDTNTQTYWYRNNGAWAELPKAGSTSNYWQLSGVKGNEIKNTNSGGLWSKNPAIVSPAVANESTNPPTAPVNEAGTRLMWIPSRSAFRVGTVTDAIKWSPSNIGIYSFASGVDAQANGYYSTAMGSKTKASGDYSMAIGNETVASGKYSTALGNKVNTAGYDGSFIIGDSDPEFDGESFTSMADQFVARFRNGYFLMTSSNATPFTGVQVAKGQSAWSSISDSTRKERFAAVDGENFLLKLRKLRLGSWNYKHQKTPQPERFYGPMAQEIFSAFGKDRYGTIGNDTTVSTLNMDGLLFIFSQALEKRTQELQAENLQLKESLQTHETETNKLFVALRLENEDLKKAMQELKTRFEHTLVAAKKREADK